MQKVLVFGLVVAGLGGLVLAWQLHKVSTDPAIRGAIDAAGKAGAAADAVGAAGGAVEKVADAVGGFADALRELLPKAKPTPEDSPMMEG